LWSSALRVENAISIGSKSGDYGGKYCRAPTLSIAVRTLVTLRTARVLMMTRSPDFSVGKRKCAVPFIVPSVTIGAVIPSEGSAAMNVFQ
jgi:hypothetical protein